MADTVMVSVTQPRNYREKKTDPYVNYGVGLQEMPIAHARALGLMHRVRKVQGSGEEARVIVDPYEGSFDAKLTSTLQAAGYNTLADLRAAAKKDTFRDNMLAIEGVGPAAYERILQAIQTGGS